MMGNFMDKAKKQQLHNSLDESFEDSLVNEFCTGGLMHIPGLLQESNVSA